MAKPKTSYVCTNCGHSQSSWVGICPQCGEAGTLEKFTEHAEHRARSGMGGQTGQSGFQSLNQVAAQTYDRALTNINEFDLVLGGGMVPGSYIVLSAPPGAGKSTLATQLMGNLVEAKKKVALIAGEESASQIKLRFDRLKIDSKNIQITGDNCLDHVLPDVIASGYDFLVVDSIQTVYTESIPGAEGSISQVKECGNMLKRVAKDHGVTVLLIGQVTKDGTLAGPRHLEHLVDVVLSMEGDTDSQWRLLRAVKNRFGNTDEVGVFEMTSEGLEGVSDPSGILMEHREHPEIGSIACPTLNGSRPMMVEVQCLVTPSSLAMPIRTARGIDKGRLQNLLAVLSRRCGLKLGTYDVYLQLGGGIRCDEPALDLAICLAIASAYYNSPPSKETAAWGEVSLLADVRKSPGAERREREAEKLGFEKTIKSSGAFKLNTAIQQAGFRDEQED